MKKNDCILDASLNLQPIAMRIMSPNLARRRTEVKILKPVTARKEEI